MQKQGCSSRSYYRSQHQQQPRQLHPRHRHLRMRSQARADHGHGLAWRRTNRPSTSTHTN